MALLFGGDVHIGCCTKNKALSLASDMRVCIFYKKYVFMILLVKFMALCADTGSQTPQRESCLLLCVYCLLFCQNKAICCLCLALRLQIAFEDQETDREGFLCWDWIAITFTGHIKETWLLSNSLSLSRGFSAWGVYVRDNMCKTAPYWMNSKTPINFLHQNTMFVFIFIYASLNILQIFSSSAKQEKQSEH